MRYFCENAKSEMLGAALRSRRSKLAFMSAIFHTLGSIALAGGSRIFTVKTENEALINVIDDILFSMYRKKSQYDYDDKQMIIFGSHVQKMLIDCRILVVDDSGEANYQPGIASEILADPMAEATYLRGMFFGTGSISITKGYHLEFAFTNDFLASDCIMLLQKQGFSAKRVVRKDKTVVYFKDADVISDVLARLGATMSVLKLADIMAERSVNKMANSQLNCDIANIDKTLKLSSIQIEAIKTLQRTGQFDCMDDKLKEAAAVRLEHPDDSLSQLAKSMDISKSGLRHRLDKIVAISRAIYKI